MSGPWAARVALADAPAAAALRLLAGVRAAVVGDALWLRGDALTADVGRALRRLAPAAWYSVVANDELTPVGRRLPDARLPAGLSWTPLADLMPVAARSAALPAEATPRAALTLVRGGEERAATVLVTSMREWADYADGAPAVRLHRLRFAATADAALVWGDPLPPLPGARYAEESGIAAPCGFAWRPAVDAKSLRRLLVLADGDLALFDEAGTWQLVRAGAFVQARRSAVRLTAAAAAAAREGER